MKHKLKNIANRPIPVDGTILIPKSGEIVEAEITPKLEELIKNKFFEDLGEVEITDEKEVKNALTNIDEEQNDFQNESQYEIEKANKEEEKPLKEVKHTKRGRKKRSYEEQPLN